MKPPTGAKSDRFPWRYIFYLVVFFYLAGDLYIFNGPIRRAIDSKRSSALEDAPDKSQWIATVNREPITKRQLEVGMMKHLFRRGKTGEELTPKNEIILRLAVLQKLVNDTLIRQYAAGDRFKAAPSEVDTFLASFESQFENEAELKERSEGQKLSPEERRKALAEIQHQKQWIEHRIKKAIEVTDEEVQTWFEANQKSGKGFNNPERFHARHIFISTVLESGPEREALIRKIHEQLKEGGDFPVLALQYSEDQRTRKIGGDLNWFARERMPKDFVAEIEKLKPDEISEPFQTEIGWHIAQLIDQKPAEKLTLEELKPEIVAHIQSERRAAAVEELILKLRKVASIEFFQEKIVENFSAQ